MQNTFRKIVGERTSAKKKSLTVHNKTIKNKGDVDEN